MPTSGNKETVERCLDGVRRTDHAQTLGLPHLRHHLDGF